MTDKTRGILHVLGVASCLLAVSATAVGCGGDGNDLQQFVGTWTYTDSQATLSCTGNPDVPLTLGSTKEWGAGVSSDLVDLSTEFFDLGTKCLYAYDVKNKVATIQPSQTCNFSDGAGGSVEEDPSSWTFTLTSATTADETFTTTIATDCTWTGQATLKKVSSSN